MFALGLSECFIQVTDVYRVRLIKFRLNYTRFVEVIRLSSFHFFVYKIIQLEGIPRDVGNKENDGILLKHGIEIEIPGIPGAPVIDGGEIQDPLTKSKFDITFVGINGKEIKSKVKIMRKIWFASSDRTFSSLVSVSDKKGLACSQKLTNRLNGLNLSH